MQDLAILSGAVDAATDRRKRAIDAADAYADAVRDEASERATNMTADPAALGEWVIDRMETSAQFAEQMLDVITSRLVIEVEAEWKAAREVL